jgi:2-hydroxychromene-2-carboxylate isomerase
MMARRIDFYFFIGSTYTYLSVCRADAVAAAAGVDLRWRPFSVRTLMREQNNSPFVGRPVKMKYMWRDIERRAARFGIPFADRPPYPIDPEERANRVATLAASQGWCEQFVQAAYRLWFLEGRDPGEPEALRVILGRIGRDAEACLRDAEATGIVETYAASTARARELGIFGSPTFVCGTEIFWGDDRLEDAIEWSRHSDPG